MASLIHVTRHVDSWSRLSGLIEEYSTGDWIFRGVKRSSYPLILPPGERIGRPSNRRVRSRFTPPERRKFETSEGSAPVTH
jgi:hypothetical protein